MQFMIPERNKRVAELLKRELSHIIQQELHNVSLGLASVTKVTITKDLKHANVWISILGDDPVKEKTINIITQEQKHIKELVSGRVRLRYIPTLQFHLDTSIEYDAHIGDIISRLRKEEKWEE